MAVVVSLLIGPLRVRWEEAARRDAQVRQEIRGHLSELILALEREAIRRVGGPDAEGGKFTYPRFNTLFQPIARAMQNPDLSQSIRLQMERRFVDLLGSERLKYLALVAPEYMTQGEFAHSGGQLGDLGDLRDPALFPLIFKHTQRYPQSATLLDEMLDPKRTLGRESVQNVIALLEECLSISRLRQFP